MIFIIIILIIWYVIYYMSRAKNNICDTWCKEIIKAFNIHGIPINVNIITWNRESDLFRVMTIFTYFRQNPYFTSPQKKIVEDAEDKILNMISDHYSKIWKKSLFLDAKDLAHCICMENLFTILGANMTKDDLNIINESLNKYFNK